MLQITSGFILAKKNWGLGALSSDPNNFSFPTHLQPKTQQKQTNPEERRRGALNCLQKKPALQQGEKKVKLTRTKKTRNPWPSHLNYRKLRVRATWIICGTSKLNRHLIKTGQTPDPSVYKPTVPVKIWNAWKQPKLNWKINQNWREKCL